MKGGTRIRCSDLNVLCLTLQTPASPSHLPCGKVPDEGPEEPTQPSHYLYVPNNAGIYASLHTCKMKKWISLLLNHLPFSPHLSPAGLNSLNFLLSSGQPPAGIALNPSGVPTLGLPYLLLPSAALSHYPLVASSLPQQGADIQNKLSFGLPAVMPPAHFMVGAVPYNLAAASERSPVLLPSTPEHSRLYAPAAGTPHSPAGSHQTVSLCTPEPLVR